MYFFKKFVKLTEQARTIYILWLGWLHCKLLCVRVTWVWTVEQSIL